MAAVVVGMQPALVKRTHLPKRRRASNLSLFLPYPPIAIPFCRVSNCAAGARRRLEQGQSGWAVGWENGTRVGGSAGA